MRALRVFCTGVYVNPVGMSRSEPKCASREDRRSGTNTSFDNDVEVFTESLISFSWSINFLLRRKKEYERPAFELCANTFKAKK